MSAAAAANTVVAGVLQPVVGALVDRFGPRVVLTVSLGLLAASYVALSAVDQLWQFLLVYPLLGGAGFAASATFTNSVLISRWYVRGRTGMLARTSLGINLGQLLFLPLAGWLNATCDTGAAYLVLGLLVLLTVVPAAGLVVRDGPAELEQQPDGGAPATAHAMPETDPPRVLRRRFDLATATFGLHALSLYFVVLHLPRHAIDLGGSVAVGGQALAVAAAVSAVTMLAAGPLTARMGHRRVLLLLHALRGVALLLGATATHPAQLFAFAVVFGVSSFPIIPVTVAVLAAGRDPAGLGRLMGLVWMLHQGSAGIGVLVGGLLRTGLGGYRPYFVLGAAVAVAGVLLVHRLPVDAPRRDRTDRQFTTLHRTSKE